MPDLERAVARGSAARPASNCASTSAAGPSSSTTSTAPAPCRVAAVHGGLGGLDRQRVHHLDRRGHDAGADDRRHRGAGLVGGAGTPASSVRTALRRAQSAGRSPRWRCRACPPSRRTRRAGRSRAGPGAVPPSRTTVAVGRDQLDAGHVVGGEAVLQAVRAAGVLRDVAADRADLLARRVGRVVVAVRLRPPCVTSRLMTPGWTTARWSSGSTSRISRICEVTTSTPSACGQRAAGQPGAGAAGDERHAVRRRRPARPSAHLRGGRAAARPAPASTL